jgi:hypothetical protein
LYFARHNFKLKIIGAGWGHDPKRVTSCALVTEETAEPGEGATFCAIWPALPILSVCSPPTSLASGSPLILPIMMRPPTPLRRRRLLGRSQKAVCEGAGEHLTDLLPVASKGPARSQLALAADHASSKWYRATGLPSYPYMTRLPPTTRHRSSSKSSRDGLGGTDA